MYNSVTASMGNNDVILDICIRNAMKFCTCFTFGNNFKIDINNAYSLPILLQIISNV